MFTELSRERHRQSLRSRSRWQVKQNTLLTVSLRAGRTMRAAKRQQTLQRRIKHFAPASYCPVTTKHQGVHFDTDSSSSNSASEHDRSAPGFCNPHP
jgi:hypothetical protein